MPTGFVLIDRGLVYFFRAPHRLGNGHMTSVLNRINSQHVHSEPFHYLTTTEALEAGYYETLAAHFPDFSDHPGARENNAMIHMSGLHAFADEIPINPIWQDFMRFHFSIDFFREIITHLGDGIRHTYPDLEERLGKRFEELTVQPRNTDDVGADLWIDVQFAINTPVREVSRVRRRHIDSPHKLFSGLFYMRAPDDDAIGGDLEICRWLAEPQFQSVMVHDHLAEPVNIVKYRANTLVMFINSPNSVHGVTERLPTRHVRRYINMLAEFREPIFDLQQYQDTTTPWALKMGGREK